MMEKGITRFGCRICIFFRARHVEPEIEYRRQNLGGRKVVLKIGAIHADTRGFGNR